MVGGSDGCKACESKRLYSHRKLIWEVRCSWAVVLPHHYTNTNVLILHFPCDGSLNPLRLSTKTISHQMWNGLNKQNPTPMHQHNEKHCRFLCVRLCVHACVCVCVRALVCAQACACECVCASACAPACECVFAFVSVCLHVNMSACMHLCVCVCASVWRCYQHKEHLMSSRVMCVDVIWLITLRLNLSHINDSDTDVINCHSYLHFPQLNRVDFR